MDRNLLIAVTYTKRKVVYSRSTETGVLIETYSFFFRGEPHYYRVTTNHTPHKTTQTDETSVPDHLILKLIRFFDVKFTDNKMEKLYETMMKSPKTDMRIMGDRKIFMIEHSGRSQSLWIDHGDLYTDIEDYAKTMKYLKR